MKKEERKKAVALGYDPARDLAPVVKGKGHGEIADAMIEKAREHGIPIKEDVALVELLDRVDFGDVIPEDLFQAVAEVFAFIYQLDKKADRQ